MKFMLPSSKFCATTAVAFFFVNGSVVLAQDDNRNDVSALKTQMQQMQKEYEDRITSLEATVKSLQSPNQSGSILNPHVLTDADGKEVEGKAPALDESFLKSLTRNFAFSAYIRAGVQFNGNGGGGNFKFNPPDSGGAGSGRPTLGKRKRRYMGLTWVPEHKLGDRPHSVECWWTFSPSVPVG